MLEGDDWKIALEDARFRHNAILGLIYAADNQALSLMRLFLTIGLATAAGVASALTSSATISQPLGWSLGSVTLVLAFSAWQCLRAVAGAKVNLPGRGADFWLWAAETPEDRDTIFKEYLTILNEKHKLNNSLNERQTTALRWAKLGGVFSPIIALAVGGLAALIQFYGFSA